MPLDLTVQQLDLHWESQSKWRTAAAKRWNYYQGKHSILARSERYGTGHPKVNRVTNWIGYIVDQYVGGMTSIPWQVSALDENAGNDGPERYADLVRTNYLDAVNVEHVRTALIFGYSIEAHGFDADGGIRIGAEDPLNWALLWDSSDRLQGAIYRVILEEGTVYEDSLLADPLEIMAFYDSSHIVEYRRSGGRGESREWQLASETRHNYGRVPVVVWQLNEEREPHVSDAIISQNDGYNLIDSAGQDDITESVDALLKIMGVDANWFQLKKDEIKDHRVLPMPPDADAGYLNRSVNFEPVAATLARIREQIHIMGCVPDVQQIVGVTGGTSGIALQLKFLPMQNNAESMFNHLRKGFDERLDLINSVKGKLRDGGTVEDVAVTMQFNIPVNEIEQWQSQLNC